MRREKRKAAASDLSSLAALPPGAKGRIAALHLDGMMRRRLLDLGLVPGTVVEAIRRSPIGDPTAYGVRGAVIALRVEESSLVQVRPL